MKKNEGFVHELRQQWDSLISELPSREQVLIFTMLVLAMAGIAYSQDARKAEQERMCPGVMNVAPKETIYFRIEDSAYQVRHNGFGLFSGESSVSYAQTDNGLKTNFGGTTHVSEGETISVGGVNFQNRGTKDQTMTGEVMSFVGGSDNCVLVELGE
jgi:hypothetical protein